MAKTSNKKPTKSSSNNHPNAALAMSRIAEEDESKRAREPDEEMNSGFSNYLRSGEGMVPACFFSESQAINLPRTYRCRHGNDENVCYCKHNGNFLYGGMAEHQGVVVHHT